MAGIFDLRKGAFDSSEASRLHEAYAIALQGLRASQKVDRQLDPRQLHQRLARSIVKVARGEPDCLRNDGTIDPVRLAQRAVLRMLQMSALRPDGVEDAKPPLRERMRVKAEAPGVAPPEGVPAMPESPAKVMLKIFDGTQFAKL